MKKLYQESLQAREPFRLALQFEIEGIFIVDMGFRPAGRSDEIDLSGEAVNSF